MNDKKIREVLIEFLKASNAEIRIYQEKSINLCGFAAISSSVLVEEDEKMVYFTADTHFGHANVIRFCDRPFASADEMDEALINNWNSRIKGNDTVYILGDMFFRSNNTEDILQKLKGKKRLILGNHDRSWTTKIDAAKYFFSIDTFLEVSDGQHLLTLCHYPLLTWRHAMRSYMIHGHIHNDKKADYWPLIATRNNVLNAGTDINGFMPVTFDELVENNREFKEK